jgi:hypothetical protein
MEPEEFYQTEAYNSLSLKQKIKARIKLTLLSWIINW